MRNDKPVRVTKKKLMKMINEELKKVINVVEVKMEALEPNKKQSKKDTQVLLEFIDEVIAEELTSSEKRSRNREGKMGSGMVSPAEDAYKPLQALSAGIIEEDEVEIYTGEEELEELNLDGQIYHDQAGRWTSPEKDKGSLTYPKGRGGQYQRAKGSHDAGKSEEDCGRRPTRKKCKDGTKRP